MDPLAGWRKRINDGDVDAVWWFDLGQGKPVDVGQVFELRHCAIEVSRVHRAKKDRRWIWRAEFIRTPRRADPVLLLGKSGGYVTDPTRGAMGLGEGAAECPVNKDEAEWYERSRAQFGQPAEPESVRPFEVANFTGSKVARARYESEMAERRADLERRPLAVRLAHVVQLAEASGVDLTRQLASVEQRIRAAESKVQRLAENVSDIAAWLPKR